MKNKINKEDREIITNRVNEEYMRDFHICAKYGVLDGSLTKLLAFFKTRKASQRSKSGIKKHF